MSFDDAMLNEIPTLFRSVHLARLFSTSDVSENDDSTGTRMCSEYSDDDGSKILNGDLG